jgi:hypothetical protein
MAASIRADPSTGRGMPLKPESAMRATTVVKQATTMAHHIAVRQAAFAPSGVLMSGEYQEVLFMGKAPW